VVVLLAIIATITAVPAVHYSKDVEVQKAKWAAFKTDFKKVYDNKEEEAMRFGRFVDSLQLIDQRNAQAAAIGQHTEHGLTKFSDLSQGEFEKQFLTYRPDSCVVKGTCPVGATATVVTEAEVTDATRSDWSDKYTTRMKNHGPCGANWAFSAVEQIESDFMRVKPVGHPNYILSAGQATSCTRGATSCYGGSPKAVYDYIGGMNGLVLEREFPYHVNSYPPIAPVTCAVPANTNEWKVRIKGYFKYPTEDTMAGRVLSTGPISVCFDGTTLNTYAGGNLDCSGAAANYCAQAVGLTTDPSAPFSPNGGAQWKIRNQFGDDWGPYGGYLYISHGGDSCRITADASSVDVSYYQ